MPPAWERCKRCDTDLSVAQPRELVTAGVQATVAATTRPSLPGLVTPPGPATPPPPRPAASFEPASPYDVREFERVPTRGESWDSVEAPAVKKPLPIVGLIVTILILGSGWFAFQHATARVIPEGLQAYVHDGDGVDYQPTDGGFQVRLPTTPQGTNQSVTISGMGFTVAVAASIIDEQAVAVAWFDIPPQLISSDVDATLQQISEGYAATDGRRIAELDFVPVSGYPGVDVELVEEDLSGKARVVLVANRVYVLLAAGTEGAAGFETLVESFTLTA